MFTGGGADVTGDLAPALIAALQSDEALPPNPDAYARLNAAIAAATEPPPSRTAPPLPAMAQEVSGKLYRLDSNPFVRCVSLRFNSPSDVMCNLTFANGAFQMPVGMDGVPRFSETGPVGIPVGMVGDWAESDVFLLQYDEVSGPTYLEIRVDFDGSADSLQIEFTDPSGYYPQVAVAGSLVEACD